MRRLLQGVQSDAQNQMPSRTGVTEFGAWVESTEPECAAEAIATLVEETIVAQPHALLSERVCDALVPDKLRSSGSMAMALQLVVDQGIRLPDPTHLLELWSDIAGSGEMDVAAERLLAKLHPHRITIELPRGDVLSLFEHRDGRESQPFATVQRTLLHRLGLPLPDIRLAAGDVTPGQVRVRVNDLAEAPRRYLPSGGVPAADSLENVAGILTEVLMARGARLISGIAVGDWLGALENDRLAAAYRNTHAIFGLSALMRELVKERVSIKDLPRLLELIDDFAAVPTPAPRYHSVLCDALPFDEISGLPRPADRVREFARIGVGASIYASLSAGNPLQVLLLTPGLEDALVDDEAPAWLDDLCDSIADQAWPDRVLLTSLELRAKLSHLFAGWLPMLPVVSFSELPPEARLEFVHRFDIPAKTLPHNGRGSHLSPERAKHADELQLFLAGVQGEPILPSGLNDAFVEAPQAPLDHFRRFQNTMLWGEDNFNDLRIQGWAVIIPEGERGNALIEAIHELIEYRVREQGSARITFNVPSGQSLAAASRWVETYFEALPDRHRPRYVLILGDFDEVALELQQVLAPLAAVGRLAFDRVDQYRSYAQKAVRAEELRRDRLTAMVFSADDGSRAMTVARDALVNPCVASLREFAEDAGSRCAHPELVTCRSKTELVSRVQDAGVLFTISHGVGGRMSYHERRARQGALVLTGGDILQGDDVVAVPFVKNGLWLMFACFGAGTPQSSSYAPWIDSISSSDKTQARNAASIRDSLLAPTESAFVANLPRQALASPVGPLAVIAHVDLAWSFAFTNGRESRAERLMRVLRVMLRAYNVGYAFEQLMRSCAAANSALNDLYLRQAHQQPDAEGCSISAREIGRAWMLRQDLRGFLLLGDPAVRFRFTPS
jgi:hypothetical protein